MNKKPFIIFGLIIALFPPQVFALDAPITHYSWDADIYQSSDGGKAVIYSGWKNYFDGMNWQPISTTPTEVGGVLKVSKAPFTFIAPKSADGEFSFTNDGLYNKKTDTFDHSSAYTQFKRFKNINPVAAESVGGGIAYKNAFSGADLFIKIKPDGVEYLIKINTFEKDKDYKVCFTDSYNTSKSDRKIDLKKRIAYDSAPQPKYTEIEFKNGCKIIPKKFLQNAVAPVYADDVLSIDSETTDDFIYSYNISDGWTTARNGDQIGGGPTNSHVGYIQAKDNGSSNYQAYISHFLMKTGDTIPSGATITNAKAYLYFTASQINSETFYIVKSRVPFPMSSYTLTEWQEVGDSGIGTGTVYAQATRSASQAAGYLEFNFTDNNIIGIGTGNYTEIAVLVDKLWDNVTPTNGSDYNEIYMSDNGTYMPYMEITYTTSSSSSSSSASGSGVIVPTTGSGYPLDYFSSWTHSGSLNVPQQTAKISTMTGSLSGNYLELNCVKWGTGTTLLTESGGTTLLTRTCEKWDYEISIKLLSLLMDMKAYISIYSIYFLIGVIFSLASLILSVVLTIKVYLSLKKRKRNKIIASTL